MAKLSLRRTRLNSQIRALSQQVRVAPEQFIQPLFVVDGINQRELVPGLHDVWRDTPDTLLRQIAQDLKTGVDKFLLFGVPREKNQNKFDHRFVTDQIRAIKNEFGEQIWLAVDVCLCSSTTHGHCGILNDTGDMVVNDATVAELASAATDYALAGADCVAPSDMMDGRIGAIRNSLETNNADETALMSYAAKFNSGFYGPFRIAADSTPDEKITIQDRASYQIDPGRPNDALLSVMRDFDEGADILMVKPGLPYLDVLARLSAELPTPWAVYQTSGEAAAIELLADANLGDRQRLYLETWSAFVRAGATMIISYAARSAPQWLTD